MKSLPFFTIIDRYFMGKYLFVFSSILLIMLALYMLFDILPNTEAVNAMFQDSVPGALKTLLQFYTVRVMNLLIYSQTGFIATITAITFFMLEKGNSATVRGGEIIPMLTSGFSRRRVSVPFFVFGSLLVFTLCGIEEWFYINCRHWPGATSNSYTEKVEMLAIDMRDDALTGLKIYGSNLNLEDGSFTDAKIMVPKERTLAQVDEILAERARWLTDSIEHPSGYLLENVDDLSQRTWLKMAVHKEVMLPGFEKRLPIFYTSESASWVPDGGLFFVASVTPEKLARKTGGFLPRSIPDIYRDVNDTKSLDPNYASRVELHIRIMRPFVESLLLFLMIPVILSARLRSKVTIFLCLAGLTGLSYGMVELGRYLAIQNVISASFGAWVPIMVLSCLSALLFEGLNT